MSLTIAAPPYIGQLFFRTKKGSGFSETYWMKGADYLAATNNLIALADSRKTLFTDQHHLVYYRLSDSTRKRDTMVGGFSGGLAGTYAPDAGTDTEVDDAALLYRIQGVHAIGGVDVPFFALKYLHLVPEDISQDSIPDLTLTWSAAWEDFKDVLKDKTQLVVKISGTPTALTITTVDEQRLTHRKAGRPFGLSRGRSVRP